MKRVLALGLVLVGCPSAQPAPVPPPAGEPTPAPAELAPAADAMALLRSAPDGFVDVRVAVPGLRTEIRYHTADNFTGAPLTGYGAPGAWMREPAAVALAAVQAELEQDGLGLLVYDAYRPIRGTQAMVAWAERSGRVDVLDDGYVARKSGHNRGNTVDLTVANLDDGGLLDMGTPWDTFSTDSHTMNATGQAMENRRLLLDVMEKHGWENFSKEWWHFSFPMQPNPAPRDVPYGCFEAEEGEWKPDPGWNEAGFEPPTAWPSPADVSCG